jgi:N-acetylglutamate synthase-like GNAT family acetyltransferase
MEKLRGKGLGKALIQAIKLERDFAGWSKIYWLSTSLTRHQTFLVN